MKDLREFQGTNRLGAKRCGKFSARSETQKYACVSRTDAGKGTFRSADSRGGQLTFAEKLADKAGLL